MGLKPPMSTESKFFLHVDFFADSGRARCGEHDELGGTRVGAGHVVKIWRCARMCRWYVVVVSGLKFGIRTPVHTTILSIRIKISYILIFSINFYLGSNRKSY